jgi:hypothetical protein
VFPSAVSTPYSASNVRSSFIRICERAKVRPRRIQDSRVTAGSWLADLNVHPETAKQVLRHSQQSTTMKYYTRTKSERRNEAIEALDDLFNSFGCQVGYQRPTRLGEPLEDTPPTQGFRELRGRDSNSQPTD